MSLARLLACGLLGLVALAPIARGADEEGTDPVKAALVSAATKHDAAGLSKALDAANALVGPSATFPDLGALADWLESLPAPVPAEAAVRSRRAWMYVVTKRGADALPLLSKLLGEQPGNALLLVYVGESKRQTGDVEGALAALADALRAGAKDEAVVPSIQKLLFDRKVDPPKDAKPDASPSYATLAAPLFALRPMVDARLSIIGWLADDLARAKADPVRTTSLALELARQVVATSRLALPEGEAARLATTASDLAATMKRLSKDAIPDGDATRFDVLAVVVRLCERAGGDGHDRPEALSALAEEALAKGRFVLADHLARRRLAISDSPTARRVLRSLPPDVGD